MKERWMPMLTCRLELKKMSTKTLTPRSVRYEQLSLSVYEILLLFFFLKCLEFFYLVFVFFIGFRGYEEKIERDRRRSRCTTRNAG